MPTTMASAVSSATVFPLPPPPIASRRTSAALVRSRRDLAATAVAVVVFLILAMVWLLFVSFGAGRATCGGEGWRCTVAAAVDGALIGTTGSLVVLSLVAAVCTIFLACCMDAEKAPDPKDLAAEDRPVLRVLILGMLAFLAFIMLTLVGFLLEASSPFEGSDMERNGSIIIDVAVVGLVVLNCSVLTPALVLFAWKRMVAIWQRI